MSRADHVKPKGGTRECLSIIPAAKASYQYNYRGARYTITMHGNHIEVGLSCLGRHGRLQQHEALRLHSWQVWLEHTARERERGKRCTRLGAQAMVSHTRLLDTTGTARIGRFLDCIICCTKSIINLAQNLSWGEAEMEEEDATWCNQKTSKKPVVGYSQQTLMPCNGLR